MAKIVLYCQPGAKKTQMVGWHDGKPKIQLKAPPVDGEANKALIAFLSDLLDQPKSAICIESGATSRTKRVSVAGIDEATLALKLTPISG